MAVFLDTHKAIQDLMKDKAFSPKQAETLVSVIQERGEDLATKDDLSSLAKELRADLETMYWKLAATFILANGGLFVVLRSTLHP